MDFFGNIFRQKTTSTELSEAIVQSTPSNVLTVTVGAAVDVDKSLDDSEILDSSNANVASRTVGEELELDQFHSCESEHLLEGIVTAQ